jgi:hypothetical protein
LSFALLKYSVFRLALKKPGRRLWWRLLFHSSDAHKPQRESTVHANSEQDGLKSPTIDFPNPWPRQIPAGAFFFHPHSLIWRIAPQWGCRSNGAYLFAGAFLLFGLQLRCNLMDDRATFPATVVLGRSPVGLMSDANRRSLVAMSSQQTCPSLSPSGMMVRLSFHRDHRRSTFFRR